tara:strand:+ start:423 stop:629 length:207 start_codon:yes stop_codon:yes gene_type:complete
MSIDLKDKMQTLQSQYQQVLESLANGEIMRRKLEGAMELTQAIIEEGKALQDGALEKEEAKKVVKKAK